MSKISLLDRKHNLKKLTENQDENKRSIAIRGIVKWP